MPMTLPELPYATDALEPHMSAETFSYHYAKHHKAYVDNGNKLIAGTELESLDLETLVKTVAGKPDKAAIFNNAAQVWNHTFFWHSMKPNGGGDIPTDLASRITASFGSIDAFKEQFIAAGIGQFGSGWVWLVQEAGGLKIVKTGNAETPLTHAGVTPLLTCDVWEHAYYLDYQNKRPDFLRVFVEKLANWDFAAANLALS